MKLFILFLTFGLTLSYAETSQSVAKKAFAVVSGYGSSIANARMILKNANGIENKRKLIMKRYEKPTGDKSFLEFLYPLDIKGTKLLSFEHIGKDDSQWLYLPELKRTKRISSRNKSGSFMASEFSYEDISTQNYLNYTYRGDAIKVKKDGKEYFQIERFPKDVNSGYSKQIAWIDTKTYLIKFGNYYDKKNRLLKKVSFLKYRKIKNVYRVQTIEIVNVQNGKSTVLTLDDEKIKMGLTEQDFSRKVLN